MQISHVRMHAIIKERYVFPKKRNVFGFRLLASGVWHPASGVIGHGIALRSPEKWSLYWAYAPA